jgi:SAM-dependent methyltransferase
MHTEDYEDLYRLEETLWWFAGMREIAASLLDEFFSSGNNLILDIGCGTGGNLEWLARYSGIGKIYGIDLVATALEFCRVRNHRLLAQASATDLPFADEVFDLITSFDVLVQIPGEGADFRAMLEMNRVLRPGGVALVRVAAYQWMRSGHDEALGTQRRYQLNELRDKLEKAGFTILRATYANTILLPVVMIRRLLFKPIRLADPGSDVKPLPSGLGWLNQCLTEVLRWEARRLRKLGAKLPAGLSAICIVKKNGQKSGHP